MGDTMSRSTNHMSDRSSEGRRIIGLSEGHKEMVGDTVTGLCAICGDEFIPRSYGRSWYKESCCKSCEKWFNIRGDSNARFRNKEQQRKEKIRENSKANSSKKETALVKVEKATETFKKTVTFDR